MEKEKLESLLIDYIDGKLSEADRSLVEQELTQNENSFQLYEQLKEVIRAIEKSEKLTPSTKLQAGFNQLLQEEISTSKKSKVIFFQPSFYRVAAAVLLLVVGGGVGFWISNQQRQHAELEAMRKEMEATKLMLMSMLDNEHSASQRVMGANVAYKMEVADDQIVNALVKAMNEDPNSNVRLAALDALGKFHQQAHVRKALIASLANQKDPVVQIALIQLMVKMKEKSVINDLKNIVNDEGTMKAVKDEAYSGIMRLS